MNRDGTEGFLSFKYRVLPTRRQHRALDRILEDQRLLYNAALEERIGSYRVTGGGRTYMDQCKSLTEWRAAEPAASELPVNLQRWTLKRLDEAYQAFFRRLKSKGGKAGFPRFRGKGRWASFGFAEFSGIRMDTRRIRFNGLPGGLRVHRHRPLPDGKPLSCAFHKDGKGWSVILRMQIQCAPKRAVTSMVGIDMGLVSLATLSTGEAIPNPHHARRAERGLRSRQRALSRCRRGSKRRQKIRASVARLHRKVANSRATGLHQVAANLVSRFDLVAVEKLNVKGLSGGMHAKSVHDVSWGRLLQLLAYKAEKAGALIVQVNPRHTSQTCPSCGQIAAKPLAQRIHECDCGCRLDRDHAAAIVILGKAVAGLGAHNVAGCGERATGNIISRGISI